MTVIPEPKDDRLNSLDGAVEWHIWTEGFLATGMEGVPEPARRVTDEPIVAATFDEAVAKYVAGLDPGRASYWHRTAGGSWSDWGCRAFPDETSARRSFG